MEPVSVIVICAVVFGTVIALSAFVRQLLLSRNKDLNNKAQIRALTQESFKLQKIRVEMESRKRFDSHYQVLGNNKEAIRYLDEKIDELLKKKGALIDRYAQITIKESKTIIEEGVSSSRKDVTDKLKTELDSELAFYDKELDLLHKRRTTLWDSHGELQSYLLDQEKARNGHLNTLYEHHSSLLEKVYLRHSYNNEPIATQNIELSNQLFQLMVTGPIQFLMHFFSPSTGVNFEKATDEETNRGKVSQTQTDINDSDPIVSANDDTKIRRSIENAREVKSRIKVELN